MELELTSAQRTSTTMSPTSSHVENILLIVIVQLIVIVGSSRAFGVLFRRIGQPFVCGEIAAGLVLGPSLFGGMFPTLFHRIFDPSVSQIFSILSQIGLMLLMFLIGLEFDFDHLRNNRGTALAISSAGILLPFTLGFLLGRWMHSAMHLSGSWINLSLFLAAAMSITAIPILGRIMVELNINRTRIGSLTISAAAADRGDPAFFHRGNGSSALRDAAYRLYGHVGSVYPGRSPGGPQRADSV